MSWNPTSANGLYPLPDEGVLSLTGPDALSFLQGQTTANFVDLLYPARVCGVFCDVKGRVLADFLAVVIGPEKVLLRVSSDLCNWLVSHLGKYLQFSRASLALTDYSVTGVLKQNSQANGLPPEEAEQTPYGWLLHKSRQTAELLVTNSKAFEQQASGVNAEKGDGLPWGEAMIREAEVRIRAITSGKYLPQDLNYDLAGWVAFDKGCYTGQEIIARLHWRGKPKRRLYRGSISEQPLLGSAVSLGSEGPSRGSVVAIVPADHGALILVEATEEVLDGTLCIGASGELLREFHACAE